MPLNRVELAGAVASVEGHKSCDLGVSKRKRWSETEHAAMQRQGLVMSERRRQEGWQYEKRLRRLGGRASGKVSCSVDIAEAPLPYWYALEPHRAALNVYNVYPRTTFHLAHLFMPFTLQSRAAQAELPA